MESRAQAVPFRTQDYVSKKYGDDRIDMYVTEPAGGVRPTTGLLLLIHGWGNDGREAYAPESEKYADRYDLVVTRVEYRHSGREARHPEPGCSWDVPYDWSKLQTIDCLRAAWSTLQRYPALDRSRLYIWGGSQGGQLGAQCMIFAPHLWAAAVLVSGVYLPMSGEEAARLGFAMDGRALGKPMMQWACGDGPAYAGAELDIRNPCRNAHLLPKEAPIALIHGTMDTAVDVKHSVFLYARLRGLGRNAAFFAVHGGDHALAGAEFADETNRFDATVKYADALLRDARRPRVELLPARPVRIPVTGGAYEVAFTGEGPTLSSFLPE